MSEKLDGGDGRDPVLTYGGVKPPHEFLPEVNELLDLCRLSNRQTMTQDFQLSISISLNHQAVGVIMPKGSLTHAYDALHNLVLGSVWSYVLFLCITVATV